MVGFPQHRGDFVLDALLQGLGCGGRSDHTDPGAGIDIGQSLLFQCRYVGQQARALGRAGTEDANLEEKRAAASLLQPVDFIGGVDGARTRDPRRDRPVF